MIDLYYWPTPNGHKIPMLLEELAEQGHGLEYTVKPVDIGAGDQFKPEFLAISPNNKMPAIVDHAPTDGAAPISVFESGAILLYLAEKTGRLLSSDTRERVATLEWLFWQVGGLGPMHGQHGHFNVYAPDPVSYAIDRYGRETARLLGVLDKRLSDREFIVGDAYSIADIACYPWIMAYDKAPLDLSALPNLRRWHAAIAGRASTQRAFALKQQVNPSAGQPLSDAARKLLFGQGAR